MNVVIRPESAQNPDLMTILKRTTEAIINKLAANNIHLADNSIKIWIKQFDETKFFPKIEFDYNGEELQYDLNLDGTIREAHFKSFVHTPKGVKRKDLEKEQANPFLINIDNCVRFN